MLTAPLRTRQLGLSGVSMDRRRRARAPRERTQGHDERTRVVRVLTTRTSFAPIAMYGFVIASDRRWEIWADDGCK